MRRYKLRIVLLSLGVVLGYGSALAHALGHGHGHFRCGARQGSADWSHPR